MVFSNLCRIQERWQGLFLFVLLIISYMVYVPGLSGDFIFDDFPNLAPLAQQGSSDGWDAFLNFVSSGFSGPTGRPVALASFFIDDNAWPSQAIYFKKTNLYIHLLCGLTLALSTLLLMRVWGVAENQAIWIALLNAGIWLLHPMMVSTTLYVVQRMAQLAALFMFAGLAGYLYGRLLLQQCPRTAYLWMSFSLLLGTLLATLSKENGALLPLLVCIVEFCAPSSPERSPPARRWSLFFLWLPALVVVFYLLMRVDFSPTLWPERPFNQPERLMTEARILWDYLFQLYVPRIEGYGLFQDGYLISRDLLSPATTWISIFFLGGLLAIAVLVRKKYPAFSLAVLFFLAAHLIESTVIGLELYFEHRNYVAAAFLFLPLIVGLLNLKKYLSRFAMLLLCGGVLSLLAAFTWQRATLWGDTNRLQSYWAATTSESARAQNYLAIQLFEQGKVEEGFWFLEQASQRLPESSLLSMQWLLQRLRFNVASSADFAHVAQQLARQRFDAQTVAGMRVITELLIQRDGRSDYRQAMLGLLEKLNDYPRFQQASVYARFSPYFEGLLLLAERDLERAMPALSEAMKLHTDADVAFSIVAHVGSAGYPAEALQLLGQMENIYMSNPRNDIGPVSAGLEAEMARLKQVLREDVSVNKL